MSEMGTQGLRKGLFGLKDWIEENVLGIINCFQNHQKNNYHPLFRDVRLLEYYFTQVCIQGTLRNVTCA